MVDNDKFEFGREKNEMETLLYLVIMGLCGILFIWIGYQIWMKERINLIHDYHYTKVKDIDRKKYTSIMGKAMIVMGIGMLLSGIIWHIFPLANFGMIFSIFVVLFVVGLAIMVYAQIKYNHEIF